MVDPFTGCSKYVTLNAPLKLMNQKVEQIQKEGYKEQDHIALSLRGLAAV